MITKHVYLIKTNGLLDLQTIFMGTMMGTIFILVITGSSLFQVFFSCLKFAGSTLWLTRSSI